jgi:hypothetical protein
MGSVRRDQTGQQIVQQLALIARQQCESTGLRREVALADLTEQPLAVGSEPQQTGPAVGIAHAPLDDAPPRQVVDQHLRYCDRSQPWPQVRFDRFPARDPD